MASKKSSSASKPMLNSNELIYQAVVIADSYNSTFYPLTKYSPRVLFPLANVPVLQYTLGFLDASGIQTVYLFCTDHAQQIQKFISDSKWGLPTSSMSVTLIVSKDCLSFGDALRELDNRGLIRSEFLLLTGDVIANVQLKKYINEFRETCKRDKSTLMTMLCKKAAPKHRSRAADDDCLFVVDNRSQRVLHYQKLSGTKKPHLPLSVFADNGEVRIRYDLLGCNLWVCSSQVLPLFTDNFDFQTRDDFVKGILENEEILGNNIYLRILEDEYAARMFNFHTYDALSKDVIDRWVYPFVPDFNMFNLATPYSYLRNNIYLQKDVSLSRKCDLKSRLVVGSKTKIGNESEITQSVVGRNCTIGNNVIIRNSYVWDDVVIDDGCVVESSLLAAGVRLYKNVTVPPSCILACKVAMGPSIALPAGTVWTSEPMNDDDEFDDDDKANAPKVDKKIVGSSGKAYRYVGLEREMAELTCHMRNVAICADDDDNFSDSASSASDILSDEDNLLMDDSELFFKEVLDSLVRAIEEKIPSENVILEINSSKHAYNISVAEVNTLVVKAVLSIPSHGGKDLDYKEYLQQLKPVITQLLPLLRNYIKSLSSQEDCLKSMADYAVCRQEFASASWIYLMKYLYEADVLTEEAIVGWYHATPTDVDDVEGHRKIRKRVHPFVKWLEEAEEESDDDAASD